MVRAIGKKKKAGFSGSRNAEGRKVGCNSYGIVIVNLNQKVTSVQKLKGGKRIILGDIWGHALLAEETASREA